MRRTTRVRTTGCQASCAKNDRESLVCRSHLFFVLELIRRTQTTLPHLRLRPRDNPRPSALHSGIQNSSLTTDHLHPYSNSLPPTTRNDSRHPRKPSSRPHPTTTSIPSFPFLPPSTLLRSQSSALQSRRLPYLLQRNERSPGRTVNERRYDSD